MDYKVIIDAAGGGSDNGASANDIVGKDYALQISKYISERLSDLGITNSLVRDNDEDLSVENRVNIIKNKYGTGSDVIVISNQLNSGGGDGAEIIYALRNSDKLSSLIAKELETEGQNVNKYYQLRLPSDTSKDYYYIIRKTPNNQTLIINYGYVDSTSDDVNQLKNNWQNYAEAVVRAIVSYVNTTYVPIEGSNYYTVKRGDNLYSIANRYNTSVDAIKNLNNLNSNLLSIGQVLKIPSSGPNTGETTYIVKRGDNLYSIANRYNTSVDAIKSLNNLSSNLLSIGQVLKIPSSGPNTGETTYIVKRGDNLYSIANRYNTSVDAIKRLNNLSSNLLSIGQVLKIPKN